MAGTMQPRNGAGAYAAIGLESRVLTSSPDALMVLIFNAADVATKAAAIHIAAGRIGDKARYLSRAVHLVNDGLRAPLNVGTGDSLADNLDALYDYIVRLLIRANAENNGQCLDEARQLLAELGSAWRVAAGASPRQSAGPN